eukprot:scaffold49944_cov31-Prasinocladus_malaysianus.AAC.1
MSPAAINTLRWQDLAYFFSGSCTVRGASACGGGPWQQGTGAAGRGKELPPISVNQSDTQFYTYYYNYHQARLGHLLVYLLACH